MLVGSWRCVDFIFFFSFICVIPMHVSFWLVYFVRRWLGKQLLFCRRLPLMGQEFFSLQLHTLLLFSAALVSIVLFLMLVIC